MIKLKAGYKNVIHMKNAKNKYELPVGVVERIRIYYYNINIYDRSVENMQSTIIISLQ